MITPVRPHTPSLTWPGPAAPPAPPPRPRGCWPRTWPGASAAASSSEHCWSREYTPTSFPPHWSQGCNWGTGSSDQVSILSLTPLPFRQCRVFPADLLNLRHHCRVVCGVGPDEPLVHQLHQLHHWRIFLDLHLRLTFLPVIKGLTTGRGIIFFDELVNPSPVACYPLINLLLISVCHWAEC